MEKKINYQQILLQNLDKIKENGQKPRLCLHACCGPCFTIPYEIIKDYFDITVIYNNSNIYPKEEHDRRLEEFKRYIKELSWNEIAKSENYTKRNIFNIHNN